MPVLMNIFRQKAQPGLARQNVLTLQSEIDNFKSINANDIYKHEMFCKRNNIPDHMVMIQFWRNNKEALPRLSQIAVNMLSSGNSSSSLERMFAWSSLQTSPHRRSMKPKTLERN